MVFRLPDEYIPRFNAGQQGIIGDVKALRAAMGWREEIRKRAKAPESQQ